MELYLIFGHFIGEYLFQNSWMRLNKKLIFKACLAKCIMYTLVVCLSLALCPEVPKVTTNMIIGIFIGHWVLDRYRFIDVWLKLLDIPSWDSINIPFDSHSKIHNVIMIAFGTFTYEVADNISKLLVLFITIKYLI